MWVDVDALGAWVQGTHDGQEANCWEENNKVAVVISCVYKIYLVVRVIFWEVDVFPDNISWHDSVVKHRYLASWVNGWYALQIYFLWC